MQHTHIHLTHLHGFLPESDFGSIYMYQGEQNGLNFNFIAAPCAEIHIHVYPCAYTCFYV